MKLDTAMSYNLEVNENFQKSIITNRGNDVNNFNLKFEIKNFGLDLGNRNCCENFGIKTIMEIKENTFVESINVKIEEKGKMDFGLYYNSATITLYSKSNIQVGEYVIFNEHNGYYSHFMNFSIGDVSGEFTI
jgi:hypothetical protein